MIDSNYVEPGDYELQVESFNTLSVAKTALKTDTIKIAIREKETISETSVPATISLMTLDDIVVVEGEAQTWKLPELPEESSLEL